MGAVVNISAGISANGYYILESGVQKNDKAPGDGVWPVPEDQIERIRWNPVWLHLKGCAVAVPGEGEPFLPFRYC